VPYTAVYYGPSDPFYESADPGKLCYVKVPATVLRWNNTVKCWAGDVARYYRQAASKYANTRTLAVHAYKEHLEVCQKLDSEVMHIDSKKTQTRPEWDKFFQSFMQLAAVRQCLKEQYKYDPFEATCDMTEDPRLPPAARRHVPWYVAALQLCILYRNLCIVVGPSLLVERVFIINRLLMLAVLIIVITATAPPLLSSEGNSFAL
jgi:hypothetical protein